MSEYRDLERLAMRRALLLATQGLYSTGENPRVGACFIQGQEIIAEGFHRAPGLPHAEIEAIREAAGASLQGATCVVTLEPCSHVGKTDPCVDALIQVGVSRVVVAMEDPNQLVAGRGLAQLRKANIEVVVGLYETEARRLNPGFISRMTTGKPHVWLKSAASLDGKTAMADGESKWITGAEARREVQQLRARCHALMTGIETVLQDDPRLTVRFEESEIRVPEGVEPLQPLRVILDTHGRLPETGALFDAEGPIVWATGNDYPHPQCESGRIERWVTPLVDGRIDVRAVLLSLAERGVNEVLVEAGATLGGSLINQGLVDQGVLYFAPKLLGRSARSLYDVAPVQLADAPEVLIQEIRAVGDDLRMDWTLRTHA